MQVIASESSSTVFVKTEIKCQICDRGSPLGKNRALVAADYQGERGSILGAVEARRPLLRCTESEVAASQSRDTMALNARKPRREFMQPIPSEAVILHRR